MLSIEQQIWKNAVEYPDKIALKSGKSTVTYRNLCDCIYAAKLYFESLPEYHVGGAVLIAASKQIGFAFAYFGAHLAGLKVVPIDVETNPTRFAMICSAITPLHAIGFEKVPHEIPQSTLHFFDAIEPVDSRYNIKFPQLESVADVLFTTGTTGIPKGVPLTFLNEAAAARNINEYVGTVATDVELLALPVSHSFGLGRMRCCLVAGATLILQGSFVNVKRIFRMMDEEHVTGFTMVPASWIFLKKVSGEKLAEYSGQLHYIEMGSAYLSVEEKRHLADLFPCSRVTMHYGLTEASRSAFMEFHEDSEHLASVGKASPHTDIQIFDEQGLMLPAGREGEICIKGEHVTSGYLNVHSGSLFWGDYFRTGDWGMMDDEGYIYLIGRKKEIINVGGKKVSPVEVEEQIAKMNGVEDCACVAAPDPQGMLGEVVKAYVVKKENSSISFEDIAIFLTDKLEGYKQPVLWQWITEIPRTSNGKIQRNQLR